jgi:hypothetical protein
MAAEAVGEVVVQVIVRILLIPVRVVVHPIGALLQGW